MSFYKSNDGSIRLTGKDADDFVRALKAASELPKQKTREQLQQQVDDFNNKVKVGETVQARQTINSEWETVTVYHKATVLGGYTAVGWFKEFVGCHSLDFVKY